MTRVSLLAMFLALQVSAQTPAVEKEQQDLQRALSDAGNSPVDFLRAIEDHLNRYPNAPRKADLERALVKAATELKDAKRVALYGERVLAREPDDTQLLQHVAVALLHQGDRAGAEKALGYARHLQELEEDIAKTIASGKLSGREAARRKDETDRLIAGALVIQARAEGSLDNFDKAVSLSEASYKIYPNVEAAREVARWCQAAGKDSEAVQYIADAFTISELRAPDAERAQDRARLGELYRKLNGNEDGLGDLVLQAYDRTSTQLEQRRAALRTLDPNAQLKNPMQFTLSSLSGDQLKLSSLTGKVVVMDFWATWCGPCRVQHPLYEKVKEKFKDRDDVVFLAVDTDEDRSLVAPFLESNNWSRKVYFEDGLSSALKVSSIPTTLIIDKRGEIASRMNGFIPERFIDNITERIQEALGIAAPKPLESTNQ
jgi:thiol-disulfide isomerase/thioredoxin